METKSSNGQFTHLHVHTEYSMFDGIANIGQLTEVAKKQGATALAITDHGTMHGAIDFYSECKEKEINPILGCEVYVAHDSIHTRTKEERKPKHLTLLAQNNAGYKNLIQMVSISHLEGFHQKPRIDREILEKHSEGIICLSGCPSGEIAKMLDYPGADISAAAETAAWYASIFPDRYFLEIQRHENVENLHIFNQNLVKLAEHTKLPLVATNDTHYVTEDQHKVHDLYMAIKTDSLISDEDRLHMGDGSYYIKSPAEMIELFSDLPQAISNTMEIAQSCKIDMDFERKRMPDFPTPNGQTADQYLRELCEPRFEQLCPADDARYRERLEYELEVIRDTEFADYFLIVWDIIRFTRKQGIKHNVRGSAAASLVLYCLDITFADPIIHSLVFERFLNIERKEMPDIDMDFQDNRRDEPMNYVVERYGRDQVAQIITFSRYRPKSAIKAAGRALQVPYDTTTRLSNLIPLKTSSISQAVEEQTEMQNMILQDEKVKDLIDQATGLEGIVHHSGSHAAGVVIAAEPLANITPLQPPTDSKSSLNLTQYSMDPIAKLGLLKMDFLGLTNLTILDKVLELVKDAPQDLTDIPLDDKKTYQLLSSGNTNNVFQLESSGMQRHIADLKPSNLGDIAAMIALYRPGPMENIDQFIKSKHGKTQITYPHPSMKELLDETYGVIVFQDQVLQILRDFAGYSLGQGDIVRKAMGKKIPELMQKQRTEFLEGAASQGYDSDTAGGIFDLIEPFAGYAFNKAHSISYALISYWTAYFKANHTAEYMNAALNCWSQQSNKDYRATVEECNRLGITLLLPCINESDAESKVTNETSIRLGLASVNGVGLASMATIIADRKQNGPYKSIKEFCSRAPRENVTSKQIENIIKAGALDSITDRAHAISVASNIWDVINGNGANRDTGQLNMFQSAQAGDELPWAELPKDHVPATPEQKGQWEIGTLGIGLSWSPSNLKDSSIITAIDQMPEDPTDKIVTVSGFIDKVNRRSTKEKKPFLAISLNLSDGPIEVMVWPSALEKHDDALWKEQNVVCITGKLSEQSEGYSIAADEIVSLDTYRKNSGNQEEYFSFTITITDHEKYDEYNVHAAFRVMMDYPGKDVALMNMQADNNNRRLAFPSFSVDGDSEEMKTRLNQIACIKA